MAETVVSFFLEKLSQLLVQEVELLSGVHDDLVWMKDELHSMRKFLKDADQRREREESVEAWVVSVRRLASDAEDTVDEFMIRMEMHRRLRDGPMGCLVFHVCFIKRLMIQHRFAARIQKMRREVEEIDKRRRRYKFRTTVKESTDGEHHGPGASAPWVEEGDIVGQKEDVLLLEKLMLNEEETSQQRIVISIVGMGGQGKTTLAKQVYRDGQKHFDCYAWVFVSQTFQAKDILKQMLCGFCSSRKDIPPSNMEMMDEGKLQETIHSYLQGKRYALVLDDMWDPGVWEGVKYALPREGGGRIIFTTRIENVASPMDEKYYMHKLEPLSDDLAWELFCKKAFRSEMNRHETLPRTLAWGGTRHLQKMRRLAPSNRVNWRPLVQEETEFIRMGRGARKS